MTPTNCKNAPSSMPDPAADAQPDQLVSPGTQCTSNKKSIVVGLYGISGSGKSFLLDQLKQGLGEEQFAFFEGSNMIADEVPGGLDAFHNLEEPMKLQARQRAIDKIGKTCTSSRKVAVVTGHFMFWTEEKEGGQAVHTPNDFSTYTHILYLDVPAEDVFQRRLNDKDKIRPSTSVPKLHEWQQTEKTQLRRLCYENLILFSNVSSKTMLLSRVLSLLRDFRQQSEQHNVSCALKVLDGTFLTTPNQLETVLVFDADKTLAAEDTGALFWEKASDARQSKNDEDPLERIFSSPLQYSYTAFRQAALLYEEVANDQDFDKICQAVASQVSMHADFLSLLRVVADQSHVGAVVVTCGVRRIWEMVLEKEGLSEKVRVIGGGRIADGFVVTAAVKASLVDHLKNTRGVYVHAFGDSSLDLDMLSKADQAIVVVGKEQTRSKTMDKELIHAIDNNGLRARQAVLPGNASPRLDTTKLPLVRLTDQEFVDSILCRRTSPELEFLVAADRNAAKLLATPMRDAGFAGPVLREAHRRAGWYLAIEFVANIVGLEPSPIRHVLGQSASGSRLFHEHQTTIVALMRGGEPMALGVSDAFPSAMFVHASDPDGLKLHHLEGQLTVVLVDSVINTGKSIVEFVQHIRSLHATIRIVVVAGVVQADNINKGNLQKALARHAGIHLVALRLSDTSFVGSGTTDTGNRLFQTTHLP